MKSSLITILIAGLFSISAYAQVETAGAAVSLCKAEAAKQHSDITNIKSKRIKETRSGYKVKLSVKAGGEKIKANCKVTRDGEIAYTTK